MSCIVCIFCRAFFLLFMNIVSTWAIEGHAPVYKSYLVVCSGIYDYDTARYTCENMGGSMLAVETVYLYQELILECIFHRERTRHSFWIQKTQGRTTNFNHISFQKIRSGVNQCASFHNASKSDGDTGIEKCPYIKKKNNLVVCKESGCRNNRFVICETESKLRECYFMPKLLMNFTTEGNRQENTTGGNIYITDSLKVTAEVTVQDPTKDLEDKSKSKFILPITIISFLSVMLMLFTIPLVLKRRWARLKGRCKEQTIMDEDGYQEINIVGQPSLKSVNRISRKSYAYSSSSKLKEEDVQTNTSNAYSKFSVKSSLNNKLIWNEKKSRNDKHLGYDTYSLMDATHRRDIEIKDTNSNNTVNAARNDSISIANQIDEDSCKDGSSDKTGQYCLIKEVKSDNKDFVPADTNLKNMHGKIQNSSIESSV